MALKRDASLDFLLELDGQVFVESDGYWMKFEVHLVEPSPEMPHGIRYSFTYHDRNNRRVIGFDNAHAVKTRRRRFGGRRIAWDHKHSRERVRDYEFESPAQLLEDFFRAIEKIKSEAKK